MKLNCDRCHRPYEAEAAGKIGTNLCKKCQKKADKPNRKIY